MSIETDSHGRLYLPSELRQKYGEKFHVVEYADRLELIPIDENPLQAVRDEIGDALDGTSREELREKALERAKQEAEAVLDEQAVVTSPFAYLELLLVLERHQFDYVRLFANLLDVVPVADEEERQVVLKAVNHFEDGMTPFDSFYAATAETRGLPILSSDKAYDDVDPDRYPLEMQGEEDGE